MFMSAKENTDTEHVQSELPVKAALVKPLYCSKTGHKAKSGLFQVFFTIPTKGEDGDRTRQSFKNLGLEVFDFGRLVRVSSVCYQMGWGR